MNGLIAFLTARLDEDEAAALAACHDETARTWSSFDIGGYPVIGAGVTDGWGICIVAPPVTSEAQVRHIARHDPARALREVEAGRAILKRHQPVIRRLGHPAVCAFDNRRWPCADMLDRGAVHRDHPDYRQEWKP